MQAGRWIGWTYIKGRDSINNADLGQRARDNCRALTDRAASAADVELLITRRRRGQLYVSTARESIAHVIDVAIYHCHFGLLDAHLSAVTTVRILCGAQRVAQSVS